MRRHWTPERLQLLREHYADASREALELLLETSFCGIKCQAQKMGLTRGTYRHWRPEEDEQLLTLYADTGNEALAVLFQCEPIQVFRRASALGLKKSRAFLAERTREQQQGLIRDGLHQGFQPGNVPHNKGVKGWMPSGRSAAGWFQPGHMPHTHVPVGTRAKDGEGYWKIKVAEPRTWRYQHRLIWEEHHGPIPPGHIVAFRDRNPENLDPDNLELIDRAENCRRNSIHRYPPEVKLAIRRVKKLTRTIQEARNDDLHDR
jgi:hypothetical protein